MKVKEAYEEAIKGIKTAFGEAGILLSEDGYYNAAFFEMVKSTANTLLISDGKDRRMDRVEKEKESSPEKEGPTWKDFEKDLLGLLVKSPNLESNSFIQTFLDGIEGKSKFKGPTERQVEALKKYLNPPKKEI